jgi:hypothetical protein
VYRQELGHLQRVPLLWMNLHSSAFPGADPIDQMAAAAENMSLGGTPWAVFDVHHYFSWDHRAGIPPQNCSTDGELRNYVRAGMHSFLTALKSAAQKHGLANVGCSEWSLSLHHTDTVAPCTAPNAIAIMYEEQVSAAHGHAGARLGQMVPRGGLTTAASASAGAGG